MIAVLLEERSKGEDSDFHRYIEVLPRDFSNMPLDPDFSPSLLEYVNSHKNWHGPLSSERKRYEMYETLVLGAIRVSCVVQVVVVCSAVSPLLCTILAAACSLFSVPFVLSLSGRAFMTIVRLDQRSTAEVS